MRVLFVASEAQVAGVGGGVTHTRNTLALLRSIEGFDVDFLVLPLPLRHAPRPLRQAAALASSLLSPKPSKAHYMIGRAALARLRATLATVRPELVVLNSADLLPLVDVLRPGPRVALLSHNVETNVIAEQARALHLSGLLRRALELDIAKTRRMEERAADVDSVIAISETDAAWYRELSAGLPVHVLGTAFDYPAYAGPRPVSQRPLKVGFLAKMSWWANRQAADWLVSSVFPALPPGTVEAHFYGPGTELYSGQHDALYAHGLVESLDTVWRDCNFMLCPSLSGSGVNIKLAEALYNRVPVLATPKACAGLPRLDDPGVAVVPPSEWPAFLASDRALGLAGVRVGSATAAHFEIDRAIDDLVDALLPATTVRQHPYGLGRRHLQ